MKTDHIYSILSFLPIVSLIILSLLATIRVSAIITLVLTFFLYLYWEVPFNYFFAIMISSFVSALTIMMIVFGAVFHFEIMKESGYIDGIKASMHQISPSRTVQFFLISIGLTGFFEGIAGFGTPGAIVPLLLISIGFDSLLSVVGVLLFDALFAAFGAIGTPLMAGLKSPLGLTDAETAIVAQYSSMLIAFSGFIFLYLVYKMYKSHEHHLSSGKEVVGIYCIGFTFYCVFACIIPEFTSIFSSVVMLALAILYYTRGKLSFTITPWLPYLGLVLLLLLPKVISPMSALMNYELQWDSIFSSEISASFMPFKSPLIPFLIVSLIIIFLKRIGKKALKTASSKVVSVFFVLLPIMVISQMMISSGVKHPSMMDYISKTFGFAGKYYIVLSPFVGILGSFITGSATVSNLVFGPSQMGTAQLVGVETSLILSLQLSGASIGNAICLFNIIAASAVADIRDTNSILKKLIIPVLLAGVVLALTGIIFYKL